MMSDTRSRTPQPTGGGRAGLNRSLSTKRPQNTKTEVEKPFDKVNNIIAHMLINLTSSMRFDGSLNVDLNDISMNMVPYPGLHFLLPAMSPQWHSKDVRLLPRKFDQIFIDVTLPEFQLIRCSPRESTTMAMAFLVRGPSAISDVSRNSIKTRDLIKMLPVSSDAIKLGLCRTPPMGQPYSLLTLNNSCAFANFFKRIHDRFMRLYTRKAHVHHYTEYMERSEFDRCVSITSNLISDYEYIDTHHYAPPSFIYENKNISNKQEVLRNFHLSPLGI
eukprot:GHVL01040810.1.p1 GENE.GHVL01040810.1~~GHVL01040810.1.p1  ORF type:complete len:275 (-),score=26.65 GHVL01040810.1:112-936(-)